MKPLKAPVIPKRFPLKLKSEYKPKSFLEKVKYKYFITPFLYEFTEDYFIKISEEYDITIKKGFETDLSSVPPFLWFLLPPIREDSGDGALVHDWLYAKDVYRGLMGWFLNKIWADWIMLKIEKKTAPPFDYWSRFWGVLFFGWKVYFKREKK